MSTSLEQYFTNNFNCTKSEIANITTYFKPLNVSKGEVLVRNGEKCRYFYFIVNGGLKAYFIDANGQETIRYVAFENKLISTVHSFIEQIPSNENIAAIESSELLAISHTDFKTALKAHSLFKDFYIHLLEKAYVHNHWRIETFLSLKAKQRYEYLLENVPQLVQRLSNKDLSCYIGITQESLSRIKTKK